MLLKIKGQEDGPGGKVLASRTGGPEFNPQHPHRKLGMHIWNPSAEKAETACADPWS